MTASIPRLGEREMEALRLVAEGWDNDEIARRMAIENDSVRKKLNRLYDKIGLPAGPEINRRVLAALCWREQH